MMSNWLNNLTGKTTPIGLDLGHDSIKMLQLERVGNTLTATASARWQFPDNAAEDTALWRRFAVEAVGEMFATGHFKGRRVVTCLSSDQLTLKQVRLPKMNANELKAALQWEAQERFAFKVDPDMLHHLVAGEVRQGTEARDEIILMSAPTDVVEAQLSLLEEMKLQPVAIDAEPICLFRSFERFLRRRDDSNAVTVLVDVGMNHTRVIIARGSQIAFIKTIAVGNRHFNQAVAAKLSLSYDEAAQMRISLMREGGEGSGEGPRTNNEQISRAAYDAVRATVEDLSREIGLCLRYYAVTFRGAKPESILLTGGAAYDPCLRQLLNEQLSIKCVVGQPLKGVDLSPAELCGDRRGMLCEWSLAAGLALRELPAGKQPLESSDELDRLSA